MKKKLLAVLLTVILAATGIFSPIQVQAEEESELEESEQGYQAKTRMEGKEIESGGQYGENVFGTLYKDGTLIITGSGEMDTGPYTFDGSPPFFGDAVKSVVIEEGVTSIGRGAFCGCSSLTSVNIPGSVTSIAGRAFCGCSSLTSVSIPGSVTSIGGDAFEHCSGLTSITIPEGVTFIEYRAFGSCSGLTSIEVEKGNPNYDSRENCNAIIDTKNNMLVSGCKNTVIPTSVTSIEGYAFSGCSGLTSITIPEGVTSIGDSAFYDCSGLTSITIPEGVTSIGYWAFDGCSGLTSISLPGGLMSIGSYTF